MKIGFADQCQSFFSGVGFVEPVAFGGKIYFQRVDNVRLVVTDQNVVPSNPSLSLYCFYYSTGVIKIKEEESLRTD